MAPAQHPVECLQKDTIKSMASDISEIKKAIIGDYQSKGLVTRVDLIEDAIERRAERSVWLTRAVFVALIGVFGKEIIFPALSWAVKKLGG